MTGQLTPLLTLPVETCSCRRGAAGILHVLLFTAYLCQAQQHCVALVRVVCRLWWREGLCQLLCEWHLIGQQQVQGPVHLPALHQHPHSSVMAAGRRKRLSTPADTIHRPGAATIPQSSHSSPTDLLQILCCCCCCHGPELTVTEASASVMQPCS